MNISKMILNAVLSVCEKLNKTLIQIAKAIGLINK